MRKRREALTIPLLIGREAWAPSAPGIREERRPGAGLRSPCRTCERGERTTLERMPGGEYLSRAVPLVRATGGGVTPVPIPNTAVKAPRGDDTVFKSTGKQRGANRFLQGPRVPQGIRGPFCVRAGRGAA